MLSLCTVKVLRNFFADGSLPEVGTVCSMDAPPFPDGPLKSSAHRWAAEAGDLISSAADRARRGLPLDTILARQS